MGQNLRTAVTTTWATPVDHCPSPYMPDVDYNCVCPPESDDEDCEGIETPMIMCNVFNLRV